MKSLLLAGLLAFCIPASALDVSPKFGQAGFDITDLWYNRNEPGWGLNVIQQANTSFATLFVYGGGSQPTWYVASDLAFQGIDGATGDAVHTGALYQTSGTSFTAGSFDPSSVQVRQVGQMTLRARVNRALNELYAGTLTYSVDGTTYTKNIERQTWRIVDHTGSYDGYLRETWTGCANGVGNGEFSIPGELTITQAGGQPPAITMRFVSDDGLVTYTITGTYYQAGRNGSLPTLALTRTYPNGSDTGTGYGIDLMSGTSGFSGEFFFSGISAFPGCTTVSRLAATR
jgi:hypothetical protein